MCSVIYMNEVWMTGLFLAEGSWYNTEVYSTFFIAFLNQAFDKFFPIDPAYVEIMCLNIYPNPAPTSIAVDARITSTTTSGMFQFQSLTKTYMEDHERYEFISGNSGCGLCSINEWSKPSKLQLPNRACQPL